MLSFAALALAVLAAMGIQRWIESPRDAMPLLFLATAAVVVIAIIAAGPAIEAASLSKSFVRMHLTRMLLPLLLAAAVAFAVRSRRYVALALLGLLLVQRIGETATLQPTLPARAWFPHIAALDELARSNDVFRIVGVGEMLPPNMATHYGLEDARGYEATNNRRVAATMPLWSKRQLVWSNRVDDLNAPMLRMLNVRYALAPAHSTPPEGWTQHASGRGFEVFENSRPMPRAFIPRVIHFAPAERVLAAMSACGDFGAEGWIESDESKTEVNGSGRIDVERRGGALRLHASIDSPAWVIVSQNGWRGWRALEDEQPLTVRVGNHAFLAFHLTAGEHDIALSYLPHAFVLGRAITASTTLAVMLAYAIALLARRRDEEEEDEIELLPVSAA
jgi:hypothetical protein